MVSLLAAAAALYPPTILIEHGTIYDGLGGKPRKADIRVAFGRILEIGSLKRIPWDHFIDAKGLAVAPGFIDAHSHADGGIKEHPDAESQVRQGITTAIVGQDGGRSKAVRDQMRDIERAKPAINFALFSGEGGIRDKVMGKDFAMPAKPDEIEKMRALVEGDMKAGALGLSTGLEYNPGYYSSTEELIELAKVASKYGGIYISHVRDETNGVLDSFQELMRISREANLPAQISHIKMAVASVWGKAPRALAMIDEARRQGVDITADVYPYLYWQSTISVLTNSRDWSDPKVWEDGLRDVGGPSQVRLTKFTPDKSWEGKTLAQISAQTGKTPATLIMEIIQRTKDGRGNESIVCTSMLEKDLIAFIKHPQVMLCSDGSIGGSHPRGAGSFPRILGHYVRDLKAIPLAEAIRKMTSLPARRFGLRSRGVLREGMAADVVVFDPKRIRDTATPENPTSFSVGVEHVLVNGVPVLIRGRTTGQRGGFALRGPGSAGARPAPGTRTLGPRVGL